MVYNFIMSVKLEELRTKEPNSEKELLRIAREKLNNAKVSGDDDSFREAMAAIGEALERVDCMRGMSTRRRTFDF